jgi:NAD+ diphosphatase
MSTRNREPSPLFCPKCGVRRFGRISIKQFLCDACGFTVYRNVSAAVAAIIEHDGRIVMTRRAKQPGCGKLDLPGGFVDDHETLEEAVRREVREELGLTLGDLRYLGSFANTYPYKGIEYLTADAIFVCRCDSLNITREAAEIAAVELLDPRSLDLAEVAFVSIRTAIEQYRRIVAGG